MNSEMKPVNRKTGKLIAKNIVILTVLITVCALSIWAWFTQTTKATADGISVIAKAEGVEVSWDGVDYYYDLTAKEEKDYKVGITGYAKDLRDADGNPAPLKLVTGDGLNFFEPYVNRRTGGVLFNGDDNTKNWQGIDIIRGENSDGKYIDLDLYFRGTNASNIFLAQDSSVTPKDNTTNGPHKSEFGNFSKDNIAAATRLAFIDVNKTVDSEGVETETIGDCNFIWAPNANQYLEGNSSGYDRLTTLTKIEGTPAYSNIPPEMLHEKNGDYYIWLPKSYESDPTTQLSDYNAYKMEFLVVDSVNQTGIYVFDSKKSNLNITIPDRSSMDIPFIITSSSSASDLATVNIQNSYNTYSGNNNVKFSDQTFTITEGVYYPKITYSNLNNQKMEIVVGYNPDTNSGKYSSAGIILKYEGGGYTYDRLGDGEGTEDVYYYELPNQTTNVALVSPQTAIAISAEQDNKKQVTFSDNPANNNVTSLSITLSEQFVATKIGEGYNATYTFRNKQTGNCLTISNGNFDWSEIGTPFILHYDERFSGPLLKNGEYFLVIKDNEVVAVHQDDLDPAYAITVYIGSEYRFGTGNMEDYKYYNNQEKKLVTLYPNPDANSTLTPRLYTTDAGEDSQMEFGTCIAELTEENNYTAHIIVRIWVEGTDREAQTPLADGIFDIALHFTTKFTNTQ